MMKEKLVKCPACEAPNRVPLDRKGRPVCGKCGEPLRPPQWLPWKLMIAVVVLGVAVGIVLGTS